MQNKVWKMIKPNMKGTWGWFTFVSFISIIMVIANILEPVIYGKIIDKITFSLQGSLSVADSFELIIPLLLIWAGLFLTGIITTIVGKYFGWATANKVINNFADSLYRKILRLGIRWHHDAKPGETMRRFDRAWNGLWVIQHSVFRSIIPSTFSFVFVLCIGFYIHWQLTLVSLIPVPFAILLSLYSFRRLKKQQDKINKKWEDIFAKIGDYLFNIVSLKTNTAEPRSRRDVLQTLRNALVKQLRINKWWATLESGQNGLTMFARIIIFIFGVYFVINGSMTLGTLITFLGFVNFIYVPLQAVLGYEIVNLTEAYIGLSRVAPWWNLDPEIQEIDKPIQPKRIHGQIEFKNVSFSYQKEGALKNVSFKIPQGNTIALVGESGSGKSTTAALINRLYDCQKGSITIDEYNIKDLSIKTLRSNIGFVLQENLLFHDTLLNNIKFGNPKATKKQIETACKRAQVHHFIKKLPRGYNSIVGERGVKLSGGEKQRVIIARTLLKDPPILVLDEATSSLDSKTEYELQKALAEVMLDRTTVVIAHRLSTIMAADQIMVFNKGRLVERGTHKQLSKFGKIYRQLWKIQSGGYLS